jgi:hypothetical protein
VRTIKTLRGIVHTEDDLRANLRDVLESGQTVSDWARNIGLFLPSQTRPTRDVVLPALSHFNLDGDWYTLRKPFIGTQEKKDNLSLLRTIGLLDAPLVDYQRMKHRTLEIPLEKLINDFLIPWRTNLSSPGWKHEEIIEFLRRRPDLSGPSYVLLLNNPEDANKSRIRKWVDDTGFVNLFQGKDLTQDKPGYDYKGDRRAGLEQFGEDKVVLQVHHVSRRNHEDQDLYTLTIHIGDGRLVRRANG